MSSAPKSPFEMRELEPEPESPFLDEEAYDLPADREAQDYRWTEAEVELGTPFASAFALSTPESLERAAEEETEAEVELEDVEELNRERVEEVEEESAETETWEEEYERDDVARNRALQEGSTSQRNEIEPEPNYEEEGEEEEFPELSKADDEEPVTAEAIEWRNKEEEEFEKEEIAESGEAPVIIEQESYGYEEEEFAEEDEEHKDGEDLAGSEGRLDEYEDAERREHPGERGADDEALLVPSTLEKYLAGSEFRRSLLEARHSLQLYEASIDDIRKSVGHGSGLLVMKPGRVARPTWNLRSSPTTAKQNIVAKLHVNDAVYVERQIPGPLTKGGVREVGWYYVYTSAGEHGWLWDTAVAVDPPEPSAGIHYVQPGEKLINIVAYYKPTTGFKWGEDARFYVAALAYANKDRNVLIFPNDWTEADWKKRDAWKRIGIRSGHSLWMPSREFLQTLKGVAVSSGSISYELWQRAKRAAKIVWDWAVHGAGFVAGLVHGAMESVYDVFAGAVETARTVWSVIKGIFTGEILRMAQELWNTVKKLASSIKQIVKAMAEQFRGRWFADDPWNRGLFRGRVLGQIITEFLMAFFSAGVSIAATWVAKYGKFARISELFSSNLGSLTVKIGKSPKGMHPHAWRAMEAGRIAEKIWGDLLVTTIKNKVKYSVRFFDPIRKKYVRKSVIPDFTPTGKKTDKGIFISAKNAEEALLIADSKFTWDIDKKVELTNQVRAMLFLAMSNKKPFVFLVAEGRDVSDNVKRFARAIGAEFYVTRDVSKKIR